MRAISSALGGMNRTPNGCSAIRTKLGSRSPLAHSAAALPSKMYSGPSVKLAG